jgi:hypothetical protein
VAQQFIEYSCRRSGEILVANGTARRDNGLSPLSMRPPPVFTSIPDHDERMPCAATAYPLAGMMMLNDCTNERIVGAGGTELDLHVCPR